MIAIVPFRATAVRILRLWVALLVSAGVADAQGRGALRLSVLLPDTSASGAASEDYRRGALLGAEEANRAATLLGRSVRLQEMQSVDSADIVVAALECDALTEALRSLRDRDVPVLNIGCAADSIRTSCAGNLFHVIPSERMIEDARAIAPRRPGDGAMTVVAWHPALYRFGAEQLIDRYEARYGTGMSPAAWAGWMAVKVAWESAARARADETVLARLSSGRDRFDGHKGVPLDFRSWDRQLRQPVYLVEHPRGEAVRVTDLPPRDGADVRTTLDRIGRSADETLCPGAP